MIISLAAASSIFTTHPQDQFIYNKEDAVFECAANGSESLIITWSKNNELIQNSHLYQIINDRKRSILKIKKATVDDMGVYWCIATNADNEKVMSNPAKLLSKIRMNLHIILPVIIYIHSSTINEYTS